jgi:hypothetical protein
MRGFAIAGAAALLGFLGIAAPAQGAETKNLTAAMTAAEETPPGPEGATGTGKFSIDMAASTFCYELTWSKETGEPNAGHIHRGKKGLQGPTVINFTLPDKPKDCVKSDAALLKEIAAGPDGFYVNLHTGMYPTGAIRGQLQQG